MATPVFHVEAAFGAGPRDASYSWTDLSSRARAFSYNRGRQHELDRVEAGQGGVTLYNSDRALEPGYASGAYYPNVLPLVPIRGYAVIAAMTYYLFEQYVDSWQRKRMGPNVGVAEVSTVDGFEILSRAVMQPAVASLTTALGGNRDLTFTAVNPGADGNKIKISYVKGKQLQVTVSSVNGAAQIQVQTGASGKTANQVMSAIQANAQATAAVTVALAAGSTGAGTITTMVATALSGGVSVSFPQQASGARVTAALDWISWPAALRSIGTGQETIQARTLAAGDSLSVLQALVEATGEGGEEGVVFMDGLGRLVFLDRHQMVTSPYTTSQATFTDSDTETSYVPYQDGVWTDDKEMIYNEWTGRRQSGYANTFRDATSQSRYGPRPKQINSIVSSKDEMRLILQWRLANYKDPLERLEQITVKPGSSTAAWQACLAREVGDRVTIRQHPPGGGAVDSRDYFVQSVSAAIDVEPTKSRFTFALWPATNANWLVLDHATLGMLDSNKVAA